MFFGLFSAYTRGEERPSVGGLLKAVLQALKPAKSLESISNSHVKSDSSTDFPNSVGCGFKCSSNIPRQLFCFFSSDVFSCSGASNVRAGLTCFSGYSVFFFCDFPRMLVDPWVPFDASRTTRRVLRLVS